MQINSYALRNNLMGSNHSFSPLLLILRRKNREVKHLFEDAQLEGKGAKGQTPMSMSGS